MRIRYAYKLTNEEGNVSFVVLNHIKSEAEVQEMYAEKGCTQATFHDRVRTGFRLNENGELVETGLTRKAAEEGTAPATPKAPKAKKSSKKAKAE